MGLPAQWKAADVAAETVVWSTWVLRRAVRAEREHDIARRKQADALDDVSCKLREVAELELGILVVQQLVLLDAEHFAGGDELFAAHLAKLFAAGCCATVDGGLAVGEAESVDLNAALGGQRKCASEGKAFVVRVCEDAHQSKAQAVSSIASSSSGAISSSRE